MDAKDVEEMEKPFVLVVGFFFHNDSILVGVGEAPVTLLLYYIISNIYPTTKTRGRPQRQKGNSFQSIVTQS